MDSRQSRRSTFWLDEHRKQRTKGVATVVSDPITGLETELADMWQRGRARSRKYARAIHPKLDPALYPVLVILNRNQAVRMSELISTLDIEKSTLTRQINAAERLGLVERIPDPDDARAKLVALTPEAKTKLSNIQNRQIDEWRARLATWKPEDIVTLTSLLRRLGNSEN